MVLIARICPGRCNVLLGGGIILRWLAGVLLRGMGLPYVQMTCREPIERSHNDSFTDSGQTN